VQESEGLGTVGWVALALVLLGIVVALTAGFSRLVLLALPLTVVVFAAILALCTGTTREA
jgi:hypothetical protein